jgi:hypothetical protein
MDLKNHGAHGELLDPDGLRIGHVVRCDPPEPAVGGSVRLTVVAVKGAEDYERLVSQGYVNVVPARGWMEPHWNRAVSFRTSDFGFRAFRRANDKVARTLDSLSGGLPDFVFFVVTADVSTDRSGDLNLTVEGEVTSVRS